VNARDAMPQGGTLSIAVTGVEGGVRIACADDGVGIPPEVLERAFEPFFTTKARGEGSGLGLATVYGIVTQAGGSAKFYSEMDVGTAVTVLFPRTTESPADAVDDAQRASARPATILLVEDEPAMREVARRMLERLGHAVLAAEGGAEAIALSDAYDEPIDLLLTDVVMPKMLGKAVAEEITARRPDTSVLFMSGYAHPVLASQGRLDEGVHLLAKPFSSEQLEAKIREVLDD